MTEILKKLCQVSGLLEMLSCMQGCTITPEMSSLLVATCEMLEGVVDELTKMDVAVELAKLNAGTGRNVPVSSGFIRMDE